MASLAILAAFNPQDETGDEKEPKERPSRFSSPLQSSCESDALMRPQTRPFARLVRHQTIRKMEDNSTKASLKSKYKVDWSQPLGEGAFGAVYLATNRNTGEEVALKEISKTYTDDVSFQKEMNALLHLRKSGGHPHICSLHENFDEGRNYYLILDLISGGEMFDHLIRQGAYSEADAARLVREVASALSFIHGLDTVHGDLKPENLMLSTENPSDAVIKLVDFGCAQVTAEDSTFSGAEPATDSTAGKTPAYCPPEVLNKRRKKSKIDPSMDMWALGVILYIMLTGIHPYDVAGDASDDEIERSILSKEPPLKDSPLTAHLSASAIDIIDKLMTKDPKKRITAFDMLDHPWVKGETASRDKIADSGKKLSKYRVFKSRIEAKVFADIVRWSDMHDGDDVLKRTSLIERSFRSFDPHHKGFITKKDLRRITTKGQDLSTSKTGPAAEDEDDAPLSLSGFEDLISDNFKNKYFPKGHVLFREGDEGHHMYFLNSGTIQISTKDGFSIQRNRGDFFGEGSLLRPDKIRSATVKCSTPVHVIEISREYFNKYLASSEDGLVLHMREKDKTRKRNRATTLLSLQDNMTEKTLKRGEYLYKVGEEGKELFILEDGNVDVVVQDHTVLTLKHGNVAGEHSLITGRPRNNSTRCTTDSCRVHVMDAKDFYKFFNSTPNAKEALREICMRRELQKAIVFKTKTPFPTDPRDLRAAFEAADEDSSGKISLDNVSTMLHRMDPSIPEDQVQAVLQSLDLDESGDIKFEEFTRIFGMDERQAASV